MIAATPELSVFRSALGAHLFVSDGSRVYDLDDASAERIERALRFDQAAARELARTLAPDATRRIRGGPPPLVPPRSISLNVAQACNMGCGYCYADAGRFGGASRMMRFEIAEATIDRLVGDAEPGAPLLLGFMGGEPLLNRALVHHAARYAARVAQRAGHAIRFSLTTNATLLRAEDAELFAELPFAVQISLDGDRERNDAARPVKNGSSAYDAVLAALGVMNRCGRPRTLAVRATVTPRTGQLLPILDHLISLGFDEVGFAPVVVSPSPEWAFAEAEFSGFLERMIACGRKTLAELQAGRRYPFGNLETALQEIHAGTHRPYPCGAGAAYLSANADGALYACHRLVDDPAFAMGDVRAGLDQRARAEHLANNHVDRAEPCRSCWARYLCGGGCYHEVSRRGRIACDYIRGWLEFCLIAYAELSAARPEYFAPLAAEPAR